MGYRDHKLGAWVTGQRSTKERAPDGVSVVFHVPTNCWHVMDGPILVEPFPADQHIEALGYARRYFEGSLT